MRHLYQFDLIEPRDTTLTLGEDATGTITMILMDEHRHCTQFILSNDEFNHLCDLRYKLELDSPIRFQHLRRLTTV
ncbi:hypothetical protein [Chromatium okenii]|jgi:hypothetical protein|uniref:Uncharacterized protein n=1 Tax=Chromatium okenii TaxID=61644 RepID=A0A2S7XLV7_9GAMM|nr:hypothetical protein [Chromatium okenii]MBV5309327.1 hypothetical protein [Chromatium okenii]PQJ94727.1 hypothetical protein CXB77_18735 [Chromatium okenii]PQJ96847.1 hypothetical protein CXB77_05380 [Chromatium okenii]PQJ96869.1 hypothetical protein CXB77_05495 [Chromatium okenii]